MAAPLNPRVLPASDPGALRALLASLGFPPDALEALARLSYRPVLLQNVQPEVGQGFALAMASAGGFALPGPNGRLLLLGGEPSYAAAVRLAEPELRPAISDALDAIHNYDVPRGKTRIGSTTFEWGARTYVMGIVNVTPDSFSGDGLGVDTAAAAAQAERFVADGADIVDVGGESTRPNSARIDPSEELRRVLPVIRVLARDLSVPVSIDTYKASVAEQCLDAGASLVNDIWGLRADPEMAALVARRKVPVILMHNQRGIAYGDLLGDIILRLRQSIELANRAGVSAAQVIVDPGIGFGKSKEQNLELLHRLDELKVLGRPILLGTSRKSTIGYVLNLPAEERVEGTAATVALGIAKGADIVRVHDVREMARVSRMADAIVRWQPGQGQHWPGQTG